MKVSLAQLQTIGMSPIFGMKMPAATSYKFSKLAKVLQEEMKTFDEERKKLIEGHNGVINEEGTQYSFKPEDAKPFADAMAALMEATVEIGHHFPLSLDAIGGVELSPADLMQLEPLFDVEEMVN